MKALRILIVLALIVGLAAPACRSQTAGPTVWVSDSLTRIGETDSPTNANSVALSGARGEYLDFQIIVTAPSGGLTNVSLSASQLVGPNGSLIQSPNCAFYRELYVDVTTSSLNLGGSNQPLPPGMYPDPLIPFIDPDTGLPPTSGATYPAAPFSVPAGQNQPIWVDLFIPRGILNTPPGTYTGNISVTSTQGSASVPVTVTVWNFDLPLKPSLLSNFNSGGNETRAVDLALLRNRLMPDQLANISTEASDIANYGLSSADLGFYSGASYGQCHMSAAPSTAQFAAAKASNNSSLLILDYSADEIDNCTNVFPTLIQWAANMHAAGVDNFVTMAPTPALFSDGTGSGRSAVDIWATETDEFAAASTYVAQALAKGDQVWSYTDLVQDAYTPKWEIDFLPINFRVIPGWINPVLGLTGILYWNVVDWSSDPYTDVYAPDNPGYPGEGQLVYPGGPAGLQGVAPSMRLKWVRDGVQDYEYFQILKNLGQSAFALQVGQTVGPDWTNWTRDPAVLEAAKVQLGQEINSLILPVAPNPSTLTFGPQIVGTSAASQTATLTNTGTLPLSIASISIEETNSADFSQTGNCGTSLGSGANCSIMVLFTPTGTGSRTATLSVADGASPNPQVVSLSGTGTDFSLGAASNGSTSATITSGQTATYSLAVTPLGGFSGSVTLSIGCSTVPQAACAITPNSVTVAGSAAAGFTITVGTAAATLQPLDTPPSANSTRTVKSNNRLLAFLVVGLALLLLTALRRVTEPIRRVPVIMIFLMLSGLASCSSSSNTDNGAAQSPPASASYMLTVQGTSTEGSQTATRSLSLTLNVH